MTFEELEINMQRFTNKPVIVIGKDHPHKGAKGRTIKVERVKTTGMPAMVVKRDDTGEEFFVFKGSDLFFVL